MQLHEPAPGASFPHRYPRPVIVKPRLIDLINKFPNVNIIHLARASRLQLNTVRAMALESKPVQPVVAMQVLSGLWELTGTRYSLTDVDIAVLPYNTM